MKKKRISSIIAVVLLFTLMAGLVAIPGSASIVSLQVVDKVWDPDTDATSTDRDTRAVQMGFIDVPHLHDGRIWTDKTVRDGISDDDFNITLSALSQSFPITYGYAIPTDTVFIIDVSGSMSYTDPGNTRRRIDMLIEGLNGAIDILQDANPLNRVAVVAYGGGASGTGYARVEELLPLNRYTLTSSINEYFSYNPNPPANTQQYLQVNVGPNPRPIRVNASTPTQWGIFYGAQILENASNKLVTVTKTDSNGVETPIQVTRRPNIVLMTDGEPTMGWSNYLFENPPGPANPVTLGATGVAILSPIATNTPPGTYYGDGSWGEMGVSLLTVLTAAYRKRMVLDSYFGTGSTAGTTPPAGEPGQPFASVGFYSIAFGTQPAGSATALIQATMNPGANAGNANAINWNVRNNMSDLIDPNHVNGPAPPGGNGNNLFKLNPWDPATATPGSPLAVDGQGGNMGALLREFANNPTDDIAFNVSRRETYGAPAPVATWYIWDEEPLVISNTADLTMAEIDFATMFATAENLEELNDVFRTITSNIQAMGIQNIVTQTDPDHDSSFDGWLSFSDVLGEYMQVRRVGGLSYNNVDFSRDDFASAIRNDTTQRDQFITILTEHLNYGATTAGLLAVATVRNLVESNIASPDFLARNSIRYYADTNRDFLASYYLPNGTLAAQPATAAAIVDVYPMRGTIVDTVNTPAPPSGATDLRYITFHVITALRTAGFAELYASSSNNPSDPMMRILNEGDQMVRWYIPANLIPVRDPEFSPTTGALLDVKYNTYPIRVNFTVGLDRARVSAGIPWEKFMQYQVPGTTDQMWFYSDRHTANPTNVTLAFFRPHQDNPFYHGIGADDRSVMKTVNRTGTAEHVNWNRLLTYSTNSEFDMQWLGNNGRLTMRLVPPPTPPPQGDLTIAKTFTGLPSDIDVFDTDIISQISFLVVGYNAAGTEIYRETVLFNSSNFQWNAAERRYEYTLRNLPLGNYRIYERGGNVLDYTFNRPGPPQLVSITSTGQVVSVSFVNNYTPNTVPPEDWPALTLWKAFHGLTNAEIPSGFRIQITGPGGFSQTINANQAIAGVTYLNLVPGQYTVTEAGSGVPGFNMSFTIDNQSVTLPFTFTIESSTEHIGLVMDNYYRPVRPPSPQTGTESFLIPVAILLLGAVIIGLAEVYRRKSSKRAKQEEE